MSDALPNNQDRDERLRSWRWGMKLGTVARDAEQFAAALAQVEAAQASASRHVAESIAAAITPGISAVMAATSEDEFLELLGDQQPPITRASLYSFLNLSGTTAEKIAKLNAEAAALTTAARQLPDKIRARRSALGEVYAAMLDAGLHAGRGPDEFATFRQAASAAELPDHVWEPMASGLQNTDGRARYPQLLDALDKDVEHYLVFEFGTPQQ